MRAHWVVQENLFGEGRFADLLAAIDAQGLPRTVVKVVPFVGEILPDVTLPNPVVVMGTISLRHVVERKGWIPGIFFDDRTFDFREWSVRYGARGLNADALVTRLADVPERWPEFFIRPCADSKAFSGAVMNWGEFARFREQALAASKDDPGAQITPDLPVVVGPLRPIEAEYRFFVVDAEIATGCRYKLGSRVVTSREVEPDISAFAAQMARHWQPARAFVLDIAKTVEGPRVIEVNCFNSAGFYDCDPAAIVETITRMP